MDTAVMALTGGIASGKSTVCRIVRELVRRAAIFDCDECVRRLLEHDDEVCRRITHRFGSHLRHADGGIDRGELRRIIFKDPTARNDLEKMIHPRVREECLESMAVARNNDSALFLADVPLLFENGFDFGQKYNLLVAISRDSQLHRLRKRNGFDESMAEAILAAQLPTAEKMAQADIIFWNEGPTDILRMQLHRFLTSQLSMSEEPTNIVTQAVHESTANEPTTVIDINEFRAKPLSELHTMAEVLPGRQPSFTTKAQLVFDILSFQAREGAVLIGEGIVEQAKENYAMLRDPLRSFKTSPDDLHLNGHLLREYGIKPGHKVKVKVRSPRDRDKFLSAVEVLEVEGIPAAEFDPGKDFDKLTACFPDERLILEGTGPNSLSPRAIDLIAPLGKGQRGLIVAPPRGGKTILLKQIAQAIRRNHPNVELIVVLLDERPEEVTDFEETVGCTVYASTFDEPAKRHAQVADLVIERAKRVVEQKKDVVLLLDSLTRLARGHNSAAQGGPIGSGGISPKALQKSRKFFGNARNVDEGGSLTVLATALIETESRMDDVIFEEFKGTGNMEVRLDRELAERRIFPAIHIPQSGTRNDDRLYHGDEFPKVLDLRRQLAGLPIGEAIETLMKNLSATQTNTELLLRGLR